MIRVPLATTSYQSRSRPLSSQRLVNLYPEVQPDDAKGKLALFGAPGLRRFATLPKGPVRGLHAMGGSLLAVGGDTLYSISSTGSVKALGTVGIGSMPVAITDNGTQLAVASGGAVYVYASGSVTQVGAGVLPSVTGMAFLDGYGIWIEASGRFGISHINDLTQWDALDYATAESSPDGLMAVAVDHREVWLIGERTIEIWQNTGGADFPLERMSGAVLERGTAAAGSVARMDGSVLWLGDDRIVYRATQYTPQRISTHAIEAAISGYDRVDDATAFSYAQDGHTFYVLTFPSAGATWVYDAATSLWHERQSGDAGRWRAQHSAIAYGLTLVGDCQDGRIYAIDRDVYTEDGAVIVRMACSPPVHASGARAFAHLFALDMEVGAGLPDGSDPQVMLQWSDDGGRTWGSEQWRSAGKAGEYRRRVTWSRLGTFRERTWRVTITDPVPVCIIAAMSEIEGGAT